MRVRGQPGSGVDEPFARLRRLNWLSTVLFLVAVTAIALVGGSGWSWPFFLWGVGAGILTVACMRGMLRLGYALIPLTPEKVAQSKQRVRERYRSLYVSTFAFGVGVGVVAASLRSAWPDILLTAAAVLFQLPALIMLPRARRRARPPVSSE